MRSTAFDDEIMELCFQDMQSNVAGPPRGGSSCQHFLMASLLERELAGDGHQISRVCRGLRVKANCSVKGQIVIGNSELTEADQEEFKQVQELLKNLRRKTVSFVALPRIGGASGAEYSKLPMDKLWETMRLGEKNPRKKVDVRAFVLSADVFSSERGQARNDDRAE